MDAEVAVAGDEAQSLADVVKRSRLGAALREGPLAFAGYLLILADERCEALGKARSSESAVLHWRVRDFLYRLRKRSLALYAAPAAGGPSSFQGRAIVVSHDLSASGAPRIAFEIARDLRGRGFDVLVLAGSDGPFRLKLLEAGVSVAVKGDLPKRPGIFPRLAKRADAVVLNTAISAPLASRVRAGTPTFVYLHEISSLERGIARSRFLRNGLTAAKAVWAGNAATAEVVRALRPDVTVFPYGLEPVELASRAHRSGPIVIHVLGSYEARKGQDIALKAAARLLAKYPGLFTLKMSGRVLEKDFFKDLQALAPTGAPVHIGGELDHRSYLEAMALSDIVLIPSRDDTLPLVSLDALSGGRILVCTGTTGTSAYLEDGVSGFIAPSPDVADVAEAVERALQRRDAFPEIARAGREVFAKHFSRSAFSERLAVELAIQATGKTSDGQRRRSA